MVKSIFLESSGVNDYIFFLEEANGSVGPPGSLRQPNEVWSLQHE